MKTKLFKLMIRSSFALLMCTLMLFTMSCSSNENSTSSYQNQSSASKYFTSEQDVIDYCYGKTFRPDYFNISTTVYGSDDISVESFTNTTAIVKVYFDMGAITGRSYVSGLTFKIDKESGSIKQIHED